MTDYAVKLTAYSILQIQETISYISKVLLEPQTAVAWADCLENQIAKLNFLPSRFPLVDK